MLCGISFNIGRIRKPGEPESDAWNYTATEGSFCIKEDLDAELKDDPDCHSIQRDENSLEREHIAGRNCRVTYGGGYSGWRIGADEMKVWQISTSRLRVMVIVVAATYSF